ALSLLFAPKPVVTKRTVGKRAASNHFGCFSSLSISGLPVSALATSTTTSTALAARLSGSNLTGAVNVLNCPLLGTPICRPVKVMLLLAGSTVHSGASAAGAGSASKKSDAAASAAAPTNNRFALTVIIAVLSDCPNRPAGGPARAA